MTRLVKPGPPSMPGISATHTAGIYADMTVDGPEIGDLVVILDKAKNLPNRKTIGKQDPYCAARLGKEAKKTQTDKRGGQTPKWDQELRFTVHDSPDYYQLKVSVFNDDKKTDLIGEAWVSLESVVVRGGGRSDGWHALNCKGRYAGEIRMELTYYDIRPKEDRRQELRKETARDSPERDTVGGPRQLKPIKRRPLPNDPVHTPSAPSSMALPDPAGPLLNAHMQPRAYPEPPEYQLRTAPNMAGYPSPAPSPHHSQPPSAMDHQSAWDPESPYDPALSGQHTMVLAPLQPMDDYAPYNAFPANNNMTQQPHGRSYGVAGEADGPFLPSHEAPYQPRAHQSMDQPYPSINGDQPPPPPAHNGRTYAPSATVASLRGGAALPHSQSAPSIAHSRPSLPEFSQAGRHHAYSESTEHRPSSHSSHDSGLDHGSHRGGPRQGSWDEGRSLVGTSEEPPPPPSHRSSVSPMSLHGRQGRHSHDLAQPPAPLNIATHRSSGEIPSPAHSASTSYPAPQMATPSPPSARGYNYQRSNASRSSHSQGRRHSGDAMTSSFHEDAQYMPPSLIPGYDPIVAADLSHRNFQERQAGWRRRSEMPAQANASFQPSARVFRHSQSHYDLSSKASASTFPSEEGSIRHAHRSSAPMFRPQAVSPGARSPLRASISPAAPSMPEEASLSGMPFSPDAYDAFNPKARTSSTSNRSGRSSATGRVPDAPLVDSRDASRGSTDEPIRGSDGRLIDPSDHLPADTWAPEPERKMAHKARSRHSPQGAQPMPASGRRPARDHPARSSMMATPTYVQHDEDPQMASPSGNTTRNRLQKRIRAHASSPALATSSAGGSFGSRSTAPRSSATEYPLRERENYGSVYLPASPPYQDGARSSLSGPPPVPAKVPMKAGRDDLSALSEELSTISIGSGARRAARRVHY